MRKFILLFAVVSIVFLHNIIAQSPGEKLFFEKCTACHTVGEGKRIGPDLAGITERRDTEWLIKFIQSSQSLINSGDSLANAVYRENNKILMPDQPLNRSETEAVLSYISINSPDPNDPNKKSPKDIFNASLVSNVDVDKGKNLFEGKTQFANGGVPCLACHNVSLPNVTGGGLLAKDLTKAFSRLSAAGVDGIIRNPPFPAMTNSYSQKPLTDDEIKSLLAFLYDADKKGVNQSLAGAYDINLLILLIFGINLAFLLLLIYWRRVKKYSVHPSR
ncbi:MAG: cytochrome c [Melioribacteraceae bacterium]|jgi:cytochrome c2|nr:c-type cytochrome [Melioribacteraceae bacterium]WKZ70071.1 MAG: cytochrome c [Melioribacteraceae bacterium]